MFNLSKEQEERAMRLHKESIVVDTLAWTGVTLSSEFTPSIPKRANELVKSGVSFSVIIQELERMHADDLISGRSDIEREWMKLSGVDVLHLTASYPLASFEDTFMGFQDSAYFGRNFLRLQLFYDLGIRIIQLTYNIRNLIGSGCTERADGGLSLFGVEIVRRMNKLGIVVDLSHCGYQTTMDGIEVSSSPVAVTHSFCRKLHDHDRGKTDEQIQALAAKNGYFGVLTVPFFLSDLSQRQATLNDVLDHIEHVAGVMGIDKVGIGTDNPGPALEPLVTKLKELSVAMGFRKEHQVIPDALLQGYRDRREWPNITRGLVSRGYSDVEIEGILGGNFLRLFKEVVG